MNHDDAEGVLHGLINELSEVEHERWARWQRYLHSKCTAHGDDGSLLIPG